MHSFATEWDESVRSFFRAWIIYMKHSVRNRFLIFLKKHVYSLIQLSTVMTLILILFTVLWFFEKLIKYLLPNFQDFHLLAVEIAENCENLVFEQKLQQKGWAAVVANLESTARYCKKLSSNVASISMSGTFSCLGTLENEKGKLFKKK